jgi:hypothetical protein
MRKTGFGYVRMQAQIISHDCRPKFIASGQSLMPKNASVHEGHISNPKPQNHSNFDMKLFQDLQLNLFIPYLAYPLLSSPTPQA